LYIHFSQGITLLTATARHHTSDNQFEPTIHPAVSKEELEK
jgi:hypothetical protein